MEATTNSAPQAPSGEGRNLANIVYILYLVGFVTGLTALAGVVMAYMNRTTSDAVAANHFEHQIAIFWRGVIIMVINIVLYMLIGALSFMTLGIGAILYIVPLALGIYWFVWTLIRVIKGMNALGRGETFTPGSTPALTTTSNPQPERQEPNL
eukprot:NODE_2175_length_1121_cov_1.747485_g2157_i0.p1 GENE.NODE_2175_length_1121_cov_1.747485_g2157_i0~~NODE_2175_length_1121_cov_1.747485_g2157_i0.p1  ORF type:complete len:153 (+),score=21.16 NODE_2175_length_1121_cov_1.747485_g2157_i0:419-877(+)